VGSTGFICWRRVTEHTVIVLLDPATRTRVGAHPGPTSPWKHDTRTNIPMSGHWHLQAGDRRPESRRDVAAILEPLHTQPGAREAIEIYELAFRAQAEPYMEGLRSSQQAVTTQCGAGWRRRISARPEWRAQSYRATRASADGITGELVGVAPRRRRQPLAGHEAVACRTESTSQKGRAYV